jgi:hypothetical protein
MLNQEQTTLLQKLNQLTTEMIEILGKNDKELLSQFGLLCLEKWPIVAQFEAWKIVLTFSKETHQYTAIAQDDTNLLMELNQNVRSMLFAETMSEYEKSNESIEAITNTLQERGFVLVFKNGKYSIGE